MFSTNHNSDASVVAVAPPCAHAAGIRALPSITHISNRNNNSRRYAACCDQTWTLRSARNLCRPRIISNRHFLVRLESSVTPRKQTPTTISNRHFWERSRISRNAAGESISTRYTKNSRIPANPLKTNNSVHFCSIQMNAFRNRPSPCVDHLSRVTYNEICAAQIRLRSIRPLESNV